MTEIIIEPTVPISGVSKDGSVYGTITKEIREEIEDRVGMSFEELVENSDNIEGQVEIKFEKEDND